MEQVRSELGLKEADVARHRTRLEANAGPYRLAEIRKHRRVTQQDLAETLGVSQSRVSLVTTVTVAGASFCCPIWRLQIVDCRWPSVSWR